MLKRISDSIRESAVKSAAVLIILWALMFNLLFLVGEYILDNFIFQGIAFMIVYPIVSIVLFYKFGKSFGHRWYVYLVVLAVVFFEYFLVKGVNAIVPNIIVCTVICLVFGNGIGGCFFDKNLLPKKENKKDKEEKNYKKILDD